jgi:Uma2 family endonuclease
MEFMSPSSRHERNKKLLARLLEALTEEMEIDVAGFGSTTFRRESLQQGLEPDDCFWIQNEPAVRGQQDIDLEVHPPPDLVLEIEVSRGTLDRMAIYAAMRFPEVWCWDGQSLRVFLLRFKGTYRRSQSSRALPFLPLADFIQFLRPSDKSETQLLRSFRSWVRREKKSWRSDTG